MYAYIWSQCKEHALILNYIFHSEMLIKFTICEHWLILSYSDSSLCNAWIFTLLGPHELSRHLEIIPTDRQLRRFAIQFTNSDFRNLMINLKMGIPRIKQIFCEHRNLHDAMFYCLWNWRGSAINPSFSALETVLEMSHLTSDYLLKVSTPSLLI